MKYKLTLTLKHPEVITNSTKASLNFVSNAYSSCVTYMSSKIIQNNSNLSTGITVSVNYWLKSHYLLERMFKKAVRIDYLSSTTLRRFYQKRSYLELEFNINCKLCVFMWGKAPMWDPHRYCRGLLASSSWIKSVKIRLDAIWYLQTSYKLLKKLASSLWIKSLDNQLASSLLTTCSRLVIIKPEQAMRTHPDIGLMTAR